MNNNPFMEQEHLLPCSEEPAIELYSVPDESSPHYHTAYLTFNFITSSHLLQV
jgi:hypothetical protein